MLELTEDQKLQVYIQMTKDSAAGKTSQELSPEHVRAMKIAKESMRTYD
jgi:hypothetical protein